uniref:SHSP domain-containing protein n=1 Tax=Glossina brevipalpis TaxID=37001 RepID=A0A1A9WTX8_9MUSC
MSSLLLLLNLIDELNYPSHRGNYVGLGRIRPYFSRRHPYRKPAYRMIGYSSPFGTTLRRLNERRQASRRVERGSESPSINENGFKVCMDVEQFKHSELNVKVVEKALIIEGKHKEREDRYGSIQRHFIRRYVLPEGYDANKAVSKFSSDGILKINVPKPLTENEKANEHIIQIQQADPTHPNIEENTRKRKRTTVVKKKPKSTNLNL